MHGPPPSPVSLDHMIVTAGSNYLDIDAYACCVAMKELLALEGKNAIAYSRASCNYSVHSSLIEEGQLVDRLPQDWGDGSAGYIIVDVSDPEYIQDEIPLSDVIRVYDHHTGYEEYWSSRIGDGSHIEFIGAAATLIWREWKKAGLEDGLRPSTARLLVAAILDNTLDLTSANTTQEDIEALHELCKRGSVDRGWCASYFSGVQESVEKDLENALFNDIKRIRDNDVLPSNVAQICVWDARSVLERMPQIRQWFSDMDGWMINLIDVEHRCSYFICDDDRYQKKLGQEFHIDFKSGVARSETSYLRKEIIKKTQHKY